MNKNKQLQFSRMRGFFLEAVNTIVEESGIEKVSARKVADRAGYNVSTLYNYFDNVDHLIAVSLNDHIGGFVDKVLTIVQLKKSPLDAYRSFWFEFVEEAFSKPIVYYYLFFKNQDRDISEVFDSFFKENPDKLEQLDETYRSTLLEKNIFNRDLYFLKKQFNDKSEVELSLVSDINVLMYKSLLQDLQMHADEGNKEEAIKRYKANFNFITKSL